MRRTVPALTAGAILAVAIAILGILHATAFDPEKLKAELEARIAELNALPEADPVRKDAFAERLLADESYRNHAKALYRKVERAHLKLHEAARLDRAAQKEALPFLARCKDFRTIPSGELPDLLSEARSLLSKYATTRFGDLLRSNVQALENAAEAVPRCAPADVVALQRDVLQQVAAGQFAEATRLIDDFEKRYANAAEFSAQLRELRATVQRAALKRR